MQISITFKKIPSSESLKTHIYDKFDRFDKMLDYQADAHIVLSEEKLRSIADINLICDSMKIYVKEEAENNLYAAIDKLSDKVRLQIRKYKEKQRRHLAGDKKTIRTDFPEAEPTTN